MFEGDDIKDAPLSSPDADALDALVEAGFETDGLGERAERLHALLGRLGGSQITPDESLTDLTMLRIQRAQQPQPEASLDEFDKDALDALVLAGFDPAKVSAALRSRARRHRALSDLVGSGGPPASADLTERTLAKIDVEAAQEAIPIGRARRRVRIGDLVSIAALILVGASLILPIMGALRAQRFQNVCQSNMMATAMGMSGYAIDNQDSLPMITAGFGAKPWWSVGDPESSNSAHLYHLARSEYVTLEDLACAGNRRAPTQIPSDESRDWRQLDEVSYAYRVMGGPSHPGWQLGSRIVVISDRSPVVLKSARGYAIDPSENSPNHDGLGQQVLLSDGSAMWLTTPEAPGGDNIWLPSQIEHIIDAIRDRHSFDRLSGREAPASKDDSFVGP